MKLLELMEYMQIVAPRELAEEWDNVGLLCGDPQREIKTVVVALDCDEATIAFAKEHDADVIVSHHPLIFSPVKRLTAPSPLFSLATSGIAAFAAHTNLDAATGGVNDCLAQTLGLVDVEEAFGGIGRVGTLESPVTPADFAALVGQRLGTTVQLRAGTNEIRSVAIVGGAAGEYVFETDADAFVTGEVKHHEWIAVPSTQTLVCAGHYATEAVVVKPLAATLAAQFPQLRVLPFVGTAPYTFV
ncbi:MAG: Nif3-like dinuclear metal center hexameric protein [Clostridia bacterium]|nr:Nif3-like dinuclear metal center hexameric protein [Clostridia bacterium]